jgi:hypothetical protein
MNELIEQNAAAMPALPDEIQGMLAEAAKERVLAEVQGDNLPYMSLKNKRFTLNEEKLGTEIDVVILADVYDNSYYDRPYKEDALNPPACFAIGEDYDSLTPHHTAPSPQSDDCMTCPKAEWGSSNTGKGKACRNGRRLLVAPYIKMTGEVQLSELAVINLAPTSLAGYSKYVKSLAKAEQPRPPFAVGTSLSFDDDKAYPLLHFDRVADINDSAIIANIIQNMPRYGEMIGTPYNVSDYKPLEEGANRSKMS